MMTQQSRGRASAGIAILTVVTLVGCTPAPALTEADVVGTWTLEEGGTAVFGEDTVESKDFYVSPMSVTGSHAQFSATGTWDLSGKSSVRFKVLDFDSVYSTGMPGKTYSSTLKAVIRHGEIQFHIFDSGREVDYYLKKE